MSDSYYSGGVPTISVEDAIEIAELCMIAGTPNRITDFFACRFTPEEVKARLSAAPVPAAQPAANTTASANRGSIFGGQTPQQADELKKAVRQRIAAMYPKSGT